GIRTCTAKVTFNGKTYTDIKEKTIPATGHSYGEPTWTWDGYSAAKATFTCTGNDDTQVITANVTTKVTKEPTCTKSGIRTCTAKVTFNGKTYTDTKEKTIPATGHSYGEPTWTWNGYSLAKATFTCVKNDDNQIKNAKVTTKVTKQPTATETGIRTCTATVTFNGKTYTDTKLKTIPATNATPGSTGDYYGYDTAPGAAPSFVMGDANGDDVMDIKDVTAIQYHLAGIKSLSSVGMIVADIDEDGEVTVNDATKLQLTLAFLY
ncbi:MAG: dockerin type I repeat-containing protein, partial [Ruminococcus sp.]|nr:dockerin type I repeat-containing protein [Ruminococcus sp.]